jgi:hypothetical protein
MKLPSGASIVLLASNYNPSIVSKEWLYNKNIFTQSSTNFLHTPVFSLVENEVFSLSVDQGRFQVTAKKVTNDTLVAISRMAERFVEVLPETPYRAIGINYEYYIERDRCELGTILSPNDKRLSQILAPEYQLGATFVFGYEKFIATLAIQPLVDRTNRYRMALNFHCSIANSEELKDIFVKQKATLEKSELIVQGLTKNA